MKAEQPPQCPQTCREDGGHDWSFDGDDPYVVCGTCDQMEDAVSGRVIRKGRPSQEVAEREAETRREVDRLKGELGLADSPETLAAALAAAERMRPEAASEPPRPPAEEAAPGLPATDRDTGVPGPHARAEADGSTLVDTVARILVGSDWDDGHRNTDIGSRETVAHMAEQIVAALLPDADGWTIHTRYGGGLIVTHDTDRPVLLSSESLRVGAVLAFIADQQRDEPGWVAYDAPCSDCKPALSTEEESDER